jgi:response regulator RpfG family c-di-GMP phosphodiesterase
MRHIPLKILVVDDNPLVLRAVVRALQSSYALRVAGGVASAMTLVREEAPDLVISDSTMPGGDGVALLEALRHTHPAVRRVLMSADPPDYLPQLMVAGVVQHFISKPFKRPLQQELVEIYGAAELERRTRTVRREVAEHDVH